MSSHSDGPNKCLSFQVNWLQKIPFSGFRKSSSPTEVAESNGLCRRLDSDLPTEERLFTEECCLVYRDFQADEIVEHGESQVTSYEVY